MRLASLSGYLQSQIQNTKKAENITSFILFSKLMHYQYFIF